MLDRKIVKIYRSTKLRTEVTKRSRTTPSALTFLERRCSTVALQWEEGLGHMVKITKSDSACELFHLSDRSHCTFG
ncbi:hypothetical protein GN956_G20951 [Arapaima gigas]